MPISPSASTGRKGSNQGTYLIDSGSAGATASLTVPASGQLVTVITIAHRSQAAVTDLIAGVTLAGSAMTLGRRIRIQHSTTLCAEICIWYSLNVTSGAKTIALDFQYEDDTTTCEWTGDSWANIATTAALDIAIDNTVSTATTSMSVPNTGVSATLAQASELVIAVVYSKWNWTWNGAYTPDGGDAQSGWTKLVGQTIDNVNLPVYQVAYKEVSSTAGVSATWTKESTDINIAALVTFKAGSVTNKRVRVLTDATINGDADITAFAWSSDPSAVLATKWTGLTGGLAGADGVVFLNNPPAAWTTGTEVNVILYQPTGAKQSTGFVVGKVEEY